MNEDEKSIIIGSLRQNVTVIENGIIVSPLMVAQVYNEMKPQDNKSYHGIFIRCFTIAVHENMVQKNKNTDKEIDFFESMVYAQRYLNVLEENGYI